jgi:hypothetical protein
VSGRKSAAGQVELDWQAGAEEPVSWALYKAGAAAATLVATGRSGAKITAPGPGAYCLSGLDRSGNEGPLSAPLTVSP